MRVDALAIRLVWIVFLCAAAGPPDSMEPMQPVPGPGPQPAGGQAVLEPGAKPPGATVQLAAERKTNGTLTPAPPTAASPQATVDKTPQTDSAGRIRSEATPTDPGRSALLAMPDTPPIDPSDVLHQMPDPIEAMTVFQKRLNALRSVPRQEARVIQSYENVVRYANEYLQQLARPEQVKITLAECLRRALANSFRVRVASYGPAISKAQIVEAEAAFDAEFFLDFNYDNADRAVASTINVSTSDTRTYGTGLRQLLPTGMQVSASLRHNRQSNDFQFQTINPAYQSQFVVELRQPILRGFGLDFNRAQINIQNVQRDIAIEQFSQEVRDTLLEVESAYWGLAQARRAASILAESVAQNRATYESVYNRREHDATEVEIQNAKSGWDQRVVEFRETIRLVRDAEDRLKNAMNDPDLLLSLVMEIIPTDLPLVAPIQIDQFADVRTAIEKRNEIRQARKSIELARINTGIAKNQEMPQFDTTFSYTVDGVADSADNSMDRLGSNRFISYNVGVNFSWPIGNRKAKAVSRRARLEESRAIAALRQATDAVVTEVNAAVRVLVVRWMQVPTQSDAVRAAERNLRALQARTQRIDPPYLQTELGAVEQLNNTRTRLLQLVIEYTTAIAQLERAKGTLLDYNNVSIDDAPRR